MCHPHTGRWCCLWFPGSYTLYHEMSDSLRSLFCFDKFCFMSWKQFLMWDDHTVGQATCVEIRGISIPQVPSIHVKRVGSGDLCVPQQWIASHLNRMVGSRFCLKLWGGEYLRRTLMLTFGLHRQIAHMPHKPMFSSEWFWLPKIYSILVSIKKTNSLIVYFDIE